MRFVKIYRSSLNYELKSRYIDLIVDIKKWRASPEARHFYQQ